jgi:hypothetical protein
MMHDGEVARHDASVRVGWSRGGGVRVGESAWGHPEVRCVRERNERGKMFQGRGFHP